MPTRPLTAEQFANVLEIVARYGGATKAAEAMGINRKTLDSQYQAARRWAALRGKVGGPPIPEIARPPEGFVIRKNSGEYDSAGNLRKQWVQSGQGSAEGYEIPKGHVVKGESTLLDSSGNVVAQWIKTKEGAGEGIVEGLKVAFAAYDGKASQIAAPVHTEDDFLTLYPLPDLHFGMLAWRPETGENYDIEAAVSVARDGISALVAQSRSSTDAVLLVLGDYFHANDEKAITPQSGNRLDVDGRWPKVFAAGAELLIGLIDILSVKHQRVTVRLLPGNHDPDASICLMVALALFYRSSVRVTIVQDPSIAWFHRFGSVLLGATHGHTMKPDRMAWLLATDRPKDWGETEHRHFFFGHIHHRTVEEIAGVEVESFSSPAGRDAYNASHGYRSKRSLTAITYHRENGEAGRHKVNIGRMAA